MKIKKKGFTLIELVIVIAIIAILAAIAIPRYQKSKNKARDVAIKSNVSMLTTAAALKQSDMSTSDDKVTWNKDGYEDYVEKWPQASEKYEVEITHNKIVVKCNDKTVYDSSDGKGIKDAVIEEIVSNKKSE